MATDVLAELEAAGLDASAARDADAVDGVAPRYVVRPTDVEQTAAALRLASAHGLRVVPRGASTKLTWGSPPHGVDLVVDTSRLDGVVEHAAGDLVAVVQAGCPLPRLQERLGEAGQWLAVDPPWPGTIGGTVATAASGPSRLLHGSVRDLVIGMTVVRADGVVAHSGGKVVKNVAGYDLGKLLTGSLGTLGVIAQVAVRLHPLPETRRWVSVPAPHPDAAQDLLQRMVHSQLAPTAVELDRPGDAAGTLTMLLSGIAPGVERRTEQATQLLGDQARSDEQAPGWWNTAPQAPGETLMKLTHEIAGLGRLLRSVDEESRDVGLDVHVRGSAGVGTLWAAVRRTDGRPAEADVIAQLVQRLRGRAGTFGGTVVVLDAPVAVKRAVGDVWGPVSALELMRSVKQRFDPDGLLSPGRFVGGI